jgi:nicotinate-nucleotide pyrophosphorylase (carboxylating)
MLDWDETRRLVDIALAEDIGRGDLTTNVAVPASARGHFTMNARHMMVVAGLDVAAHVFKTISPSCEIDLVAEDGAVLSAGDALASVRGEARGLLTAERTALNFLQFMTSVATNAHAFVTAIQGTGVTMVDTRKTIPGFRNLSKYATQLGGVRNHRIRLDDGVLIKDNHISMAGGVGAAISNARKGVPLLTKIEVECDTLEQVSEALDVGADMILLDNMSLDDLRSAVALSAGRTPLEASGGVTLETVRGIAETGVDFISSGRMTQSPPAADIGMDVRFE